MADDSHSRKRHERVKELLFEALEQPHSDRSRLLRAACGDDEGLWNEARSLLAQMTALDGFLDKPLDFSGPVIPECPERLGRFRIHRLLGFGGMGVVYLAEEKVPPRLVALKALRIESASELMRQRFTREAEALARFSHPGIASVYSAEVVETHLGQQPIISMEYVDGQPIIEAAQQAGLGVRERVELIVQVADAVEHAHRAGVLHRDLKPDNVLVDQSGAPRILDFGIAHVVESGVDSLLTQTGQMLGTIVYMSPEQARGGRATGRSDQFSLAVMLYELLCGELPFETRDQLVHDAISSLAAGVWVRPSVYDPSLRGDLETVLAKALDPEPARRYGSIAAFAADLEAWLAGRPIAARPQSWAYQLGMCVKRNRALSASLTAIVLALIVGTGIAVFGLTRAWSEASMATLFSQRAQLDALVDEEASLWPADSTTVARMESWLARAEDLIAGHEAQRAFLVEMQAGLGPGFLDRKYGGDWLTGEAQRLVRDLEALVAADGLLPQIQDRERLAKGLRAATVERYASAWAAVRERLTADARFPDLPPQEGLIPLGPDPESGLEEFALYAEGRDVPARDAEGHIAMGDAGCLVFVLIPGGQALIGAQDQDPEAPQYDPRAHAPPGNNCNEGPTFTVWLDAYLISKYEMTQAQWIAAFGGNPSDLDMGSEMMGFEDSNGIVYRDELIAGTHPVESVTWLEAVERLAELGLLLPTEAQWEHAARGGVSTPYTHGADASATVGTSNYDVLAGWELADWGEQLPFDGYRYHAPVGTFAPNAYGLHDVLGNVWELCRDNYKVYYHALEHRPGDGLVLAEPDGDVSRRGGGYWVGPLFIRLSSRQMLLMGAMNSTTGVRPLRPLQLFGEAASQQVGPTRSEGRDPR